MHTSGAVYQRESPWGREMWKAVDVESALIGAVEVKSAHGAVDEESAHGAVDVESAQGAVNVESAQGAEDGKVPWSSG